MSEVSTFQGESSSSRWHELPAEILQKMIFDKFDNDSFKQNLLTCRLVNRHWKSSSEKVLEMKCLDAWKWKPSSASPSPSLSREEALPTFNPYREATMFFRQHDSSAQEFNNFPTLQVNETSGRTMLKWVLCPPIMSAENQLCSIPTKFLRLQFNKDHVAEEKYTKIPVQTMFSNYGQSLSCIELVNFSVSVFVLNNIFQTLENVKAMTISNVILKRGASKNYQNPIVALPKLEHLKLTLLPCKKQNNDESYRWLLSSFVENLKSLETDGQFFTYLENAEAHSSSTNFSKLKEFSVMEVPNSYPGRVAVANFPVLQKVSLTLLFNDKSVLVWDKLENVLHFLASSASTLAYLHLEFKEWARQQIDLNLVPQKIPFNFPKLTTLGIFYPMVAGEKGALERFFKVAPNLEHLKLFRFITETQRKWHRELNGLPLDTDRRSYRKVCPQIKKLSTYMGWDEQNKLSTLRF